MLMYLLFLLCVISSKQEPLRRLKEPNTGKLNLTRRILNGKNAGNTRPYMVYLRGETTGSKTDPDWLCGGVIIHPRHILTSAACVQHATRFYVVSGTKEWMLPLPGNKTKDCIKYGAKKVIAKFVPKGSNPYWVDDYGLRIVRRGLAVPRKYIYDGDEFNNIKWMANDIAIVKVDEEFNFKRRVIGCCYIPQMASFNNQSEELEKPRTEASLAGWGSTDKFSEVGLSAPENSHYLQESKLFIITKKNCKKLWPERYHYIIDDMICARDKAVRQKPCDRKDKDCQDKDPDYSFEEQLTMKLRRYLDDNETLVHSAAAHEKTRRASLNIGGFCENDHGGPLVVGRGKRSVVVGIITACQTEYKNQRCKGPFLFSSVWQHRHFINCVINDEMRGETCQHLFESRKTGVEQTNFDWSSTPKGSKKEVASEEDEVRRAQGIYEPENNENGNEDIDNAESDTDEKSTSKNII